MLNKPLRIHINIIQLNKIIVQCKNNGHFSWLYLNTKSPWSAALAHGSINAVAGLPILFFQPGFNMAFGGTIATPVAWLGMGLFILWLAWTKRLPVLNQLEETRAGSSQE